MSEPTEPPVLTDKDIRWAWGDTPQERAAASPRVASVLSITDALTRWRDGVEREATIPRLTTGFPTVDRYSRGLEPGECFTVLGRTATGKTLIAGAIAEHILTVRPASAVLMVNLEMPCPQLVARFLRAHFRRTDDVIERDVRADKLDVAPFTEKFSNLFFLDKGAVSLEEIEVQYEDLARVIAPMPIDAIVIDHAGLLRGSRGRSAYEHATASAVEAKQLARRLNTVVVLLVQANRAGKQEDDPVPLESARDSGAYEENADFLLALGQIKDIPGQRPYLKARLAKNRRGPTVPLTLSFDSISLRMAEVEEHRD